MVHPIWRLSETGENNLGLACNEEGLVLGRTLLIERRDGRFVARDASDIQRLLSCAYRKSIRRRSSTDSRLLRLRLTPTIFC
jgi:hypothetical protein